MKRKEISSVSNYSEESTLLIDLLHSTSGLKLSSSLSLLMNSLRSLVPIFNPSDASNTTPTSSLEPNLKSIIVYNFD